MTKKNGFIRLRPGQVAVKVELLFQLEGLVAGVRLPTPFSFWKKIVSKLVRLTLENISALVKRFKEGYK
jgi:hypothetical protein